jgi:hypothetical protein
VGGLGGSPRRADLATVCCLRACHRTVLTCDGTARYVALSHGGCYRHHLHTPFRRAGVSRGAQTSGKSSEVGYCIRLAVKRGRIAQHRVRASRPAIFIAAFSSSASDHDQLRPTASVSRAFAHIAMLCLRWWFAGASVWSDLQAFADDSRCDTTIGLEQVTGVGYYGSDASERCSCNVGALVRARECSLRPCSAVRGIGSPLLCWPCSSKLRV